VNDKLVAALNEAIRYGLKAAALLDRDGAIVARAGTG
jgi:hypothetical protein